MASTYASSSAISNRGGPYKAPVPTSNAPQGTFLPGTKVQVGSHRVTIEKYLSEGGFAHVYVVRVPRDNHKHELAVLKRVAVPDKEHLASMRTEVETMKKVKGHKHVVTYMDSHASQLKGGGYEVFLLMEFCAGGGLIDFMNTRLQHRLTEPEIWKIFGDVAEGVACMHYLKPPLLHRDLKVENVLIAKTGNSGAPIYKLCDFGSTAPPRPAATTAEEGRLIEEDVQKHTTMQYRSPEMIDVWRKQPIDEKADIWALGVLLYKLCYYTTPFEDVGQMAILNASYKFPPHPNFSDRIKKFIAWMLKADPKQRPNIYQVVKEACNVQGLEVPIKDIYANRSHSEARRNEALPSPDPPMSLGLQKQAPEAKTQALPDITPMRRGRPQATSQAPVAATKPSPSPAKGDPFAALDSKNYDVRVGAIDELSKRYPSLDEFSIVHDQKSPFHPRSDQRPSESSLKPLKERVTEALADEAFGQLKPKPKVAADLPKSQSTSQIASSTTANLKPTATKPRDIPQSSLVHQPTPVRPAMKYTSTGTGASPPGTPALKLPEVSTRPIWRVPDHHRSSSQPRASSTAQAAAASLQPKVSTTQRPALLDLHRSKSQIATVNLAKSPTSSRPSLEGHRPSQLELGEPEIHRAKSAQSRQRPSSVYVSSNLDYLKDQETARKRPTMESRRQSRQEQSDSNVAVEGNIEDDMEYLRSNEAEEKIFGHRKSSGHKKRSSLASISGGARSMFAGRFGDAFKRYEHSGSPTEQHNSFMNEARPRSRGEGLEPRMLSPVAGSEAAHSRDSYTSDNEEAIDETEDLPPDMRREMERRRLSQEERRVAEAAAEYRERGAGVVPSRATTIQKRVQSLLDEGRQSPVPVRRTAEGYGRYTDNPEPSPGEPSASASTAKVAPRTVPQPEPSDVGSNNPYPRTRQRPAEPQPPVVPIPPASAPPSQLTASQPRVASRPSVPPKSQALRTGAGSGKPSWPPPSSQPEAAAPPSPAKPSGALAALLAKDLEGVPDYPPRTSTVQAPAVPEKQPDLMDFDGADQVADDLEEDFSKRYPSLSGFELEERSSGSAGKMTMREV